MKKKSKKHVTDYRGMGDAVLESKSATLAIAIAGMLLGVVFIFTNLQSMPASRAEAKSYTIEFERYEASENWCTVYAKDGTEYEIFPHAQRDTVEKRMDALATGTVLYLLVDPNSGYIMEATTATEELLNFEQSRSNIVSEAKGFIILGAVICFAGVFLIGYVIVSHAQEKKEANRRSQKEKKRTKGKDDPVMRRADRNVKHRVLLSATVGNYNICYRRVKTVNELVVNGRVYDEKKALFEFSHLLSAVIDGHTVEAGLENDESYIAFDGAVVAKKRRVI